MAQKVRIHGDCLLTLLRLAGTEEKKLQLSHLRARDFLKSVTYLGGAGRGIGLETHHQRDQP